MAETLPTTPPPSQADRLKAVARAGAGWREEVAREARDHALREGLHDQNSAQNIPVSPSNSRNDDKFVTPPSLIEAGIDSLRVLWPLRTERERWAARAAYRARLKLGSVGVLWEPRGGWLATEGRPVTLLDPDSHDLWPPDALDEARELLRREVGGCVGIDLRCRRGEVARLDVTTTLRCKRADGLALLRGVLALDVPRRFPVIYRRPPETVYWYSHGDVVQERIYDKGAEAGTAPRGELIRFEVQERFHKRQRDTLGGWDGERCRNLYARRMGALRASGDGFRVMTLDLLIERLAGYAEEGRISLHAAARLVGYLQLERAGTTWPKRTAQRHRAELRRLGLALALDGEEPVDLDLPAALDEALRPDAW